MGSGRSSGPGGGRGRFASLTCSSVTTLATRSRKALNGSSRSGSTRSETTVLTQDATRLRPPPNHARSPATARSVLRSRQPGVVGGTA